MKTLLRYIILAACLLTALFFIGFSQANGNSPSISLSRYLPLAFNEFSTQAGQIIFIGTDSNNYGNRYIYKIKNDGTGQVQLTNNPMLIFYNRWSPDGSKIAFEGYTTDNSEIYVMNADGTGLVNLTNNPASDIDPTWSNNGSQIAFISGRSGSMQVYVMNADGSNVTQLTSLESGCTNPIWSPVGNQIAFDTLGENYDDEEIYAINSDGSGLIRLSENAYYDSIEGWSPDGTKILFLSDRDAITSEDLYTINPHDANVTRLTDDGSVVSAEWSPDGQNIAIGSSKYSLYLIDQNGLNPTFMSCQSEGIHTFDPAWSRDSSEIAYSPSSVIGDTTGIYVVQVDGSGCKHLTTMLASSPQWSP